MKISPTNGRRLGGFGGAISVTVSSLTTLDLGNSSASIERLSFESLDGWIVGETTSNNHLRLSDGDSAEVLSTGKSVLIGANAGSNENSLTIAGTLEANEVFVGNEGNFGNQLIFEATASQTIGAITLFADNQLLLEGDFSTFELLGAQLGATDLLYSIGGLTEPITGDNVEDLLSLNFDSGTGFTSITAVSPVLLGDVNLNGTVDFLDIAPFISILSTGAFQAEADVDQSGSVDFLDILPFIGILSDS